MLRMNTTGSPDLDQVRRVLAAHRNTLMALPGVVSVGIGRPDPTGPYVISVLTEGPRPVDGPDRLDDVKVVWTRGNRPQLQTTASPPTEPAPTDAEETDTTSTEAPDRRRSTDQEP
jgi:hypothetical protein